MKQTLLSHFLLALCLSFIIRDGVRAQVQDVSDYMLWVRVSDDFAVADTALNWFINVQGGSYNRDSLGGFCAQSGDVCIPYTLQEIVPPPSPPTGLWVLWTAYRPPAAGAYGGFGQWNPPSGPSVPLDIHGIPSNATVKDTFQLSIQYFGTDADFSDFHLRWPGSTYLAANCDSMFLTPKTLGLLDGSGNPVPTRLDMKSTDHLDLKRPIQSAGTSSFSFHIYRYGVPSVLGVNRDGGGRTPSSFSLHQNYPNPFNPSTTMSFDLPTRAFAEVSVYNVLGERVAVLTSSDLPAGSHTSTWNGLTLAGSPASSGVYFVRMTASAGPGRPDFSAVRKIVLMR